MPLADFLALVSVHTGVRPDSIAILSGFPPRPVPGLPGGAAGRQLSDLGLASGDTFTVREDPGVALPSVPADAAPAPAGDNAGMAAGAANGSAGRLGACGDTRHETAGDEDLARALAASMQDAQGGGAVAPPPPQLQMQQPRQPAPGSGPGGAAGGEAGVSVSNAAPGAGGPAPASVVLADGSSVTRRVIDSDNSCLFNAVGYVMEHTRSRWAIGWKGRAIRGGVRPFHRSGEREGNKGWSEAGLGGGVRQGLGGGRGGQ
eukprot:363392-Chlamydomonas_euryale.AAC.4